MNNPIIQSILAQIGLLEKRLQQLLLLSQRSETTGGVERVAFAQLPIAGSKGRIRYCTDCRKSGEGRGAGTGCLVVDDVSAGIPTWVRVDDPTQVAQN